MTIVNQMLPFIDTRKIGAELYKKMEDPIKTAIIADGIVPQFMQDFIGAGVENKIMANDVLVKRLSEEQETVRSAVEVIMGEICKNITQEAQFENNNDRR